MFPVKSHDRGITQLCLELIIIFDAFNFEVTLIEETLIEDYQKFKTREYGVKFDIHIHFDIYNNVDDWDKEMMELLNYLISEFVNDCVLEYYGIPVMKKINGNIEVDESKSGRLKNLPFDILYS